MISCTMRRDMDPPHAQCTAAGSTRPRLGRRRLSGRTHVHVRSPDMGGPCLGPCKCRPHGHGSVGDMQACSVHVLLNYPSSINAACSKGSSSVLVLNLRKFLQTNLLHRKYYQGKYPSNVDIGSTLEIKYIE